MGFYTTTSLNRYANLGHPSENDDSLSDYWERIHDTYIENQKSLEIAKKHGVSLSVETSQECYQLLFVIHNEGSEITNHFYEDEFWDLPDIKDDETFFQRSEDFIKEFVSVFPEFEGCEFGTVGKRFSASS